MTGALGRSTRHHETKGPIIMYHQPSRLVVVHSSDWKKSNSFWTEAGGFSVGQKRDLKCLSSDGKSRLDSSVVPMKLPARQRPFVSTWRSG